VVGPSSIEVTVRAGDVKLIPGPEGQIDVTVDGSASDTFRVEQVGSSVVVEAPRGRGSRFRRADVTVALPDGSDVDIRVTAGDVTGAAPLGDFRVAAAAGDIRLGNARSGSVKTASGDISLGNIDGDLTVGTASGDVRVGAVAGDIDAKTMSGDIDVRSFGGSRCTAGSMAGNIRLGIPAGRRLQVELQTMSGDVRNDLPFRPGSESGQVALTVKTMSGDIVLVPAPTH
jgi:DUF4097 and DUF4098 domain-containing protein YvlB